MPRPKAGEQPRRFHGGYHDAADFDVLANHLEVPSELVVVYEMFPDAFADGDLDLPESGNGIPDILDEAEWCLMAFLELQLPNGAVPMGRSNLQDSLLQILVEGYHPNKKDHNAVTPYGILPPDWFSTPFFAATAAQYSRAIRKFDAAKADRYLAAAEKAFAYASTHTREQVWQEYSTPEYKMWKPGERKDKSLNWQEGAWTNVCVWAAGELLRTTGKADYAKYVQAHPQSKELYWSFHATSMRIPWAIANAEKADAALRERYRTILAGAPAAGKLLQKSSETPYRAYVWGGGWWGSLQGIQNSSDVVRSIALTGDQQFTDLLSLSIDWHLGCNPIAQSFITGLGYRYPRRPEISHFLYEFPEQDLGGKTVKGISLYGIGGGWRDTWGGWPPVRVWRDVWDNMAEVNSEFTINQTLTPAAVTYAALYALEKKAGRIPPGSKPNPLDH